eukprot:m.72499 g.72499  ORF g.72499 m.72499 type:complete len:175 (+) comp8786_c0_seq2:123-647(+)
MGERTLDHVALQRLSLQEDQTRNELEALRARRAEVMKARINDLESDLAEAEATIAGLREAVAARTDSAHAAADDLLLLLEAAPDKVMPLRRELQHKYQVFDGNTGVGAGAGGALRGGPTNALAESTLVDVAGRLDAMVERAKQGRGSITALRDAVSDLNRVVPGRDDEPISFGV